MAHEINIYTSSFKMINILNGIEPLPGFVHRFHLSGHALRPAGLNIVITGSAGLGLRLSKDLSAELNTDAKYILCSRTPQLLTEAALSRLYDLWPLPLTAGLIRFHFRNVQTRLKFELENTSEHLEHQKRILEMARQDYLTGLATRWYLQDFIERNREQNITCIYFDLDNFKSVNDTFGHHAGDRALAATAEMMQREFPDGFAARMGGDEFMLVLTGKQDITAVQQRVNALIAGLLKYYSGTRTMQCLSVSAGISQTAGGNSKTIDEIIHEADTALYEAKKAGKAQSRIFR